MHRYLEYILWRFSLSMHGGLPYLLCTNDGGRSSTSIFSRPASSLFTRIAMLSPFTEKQMRLLRNAQHALLSFETAANLDAWTPAVFQALRPLLKTDQLYYLQPSRVAPPLSKSEDTSLEEGRMPFAFVTPGSSRDNTGGNGNLAGGDGAPRGEKASLIVRSPSLGDDFTGGVKRHFVGFEDGFSIFREAYPTLMHRLVRAGGTGAVHDAPLYDPKQRKRLDLYQEVFRPVRIVRQMALAQPLPQGEALLIAGFDETQVPEFDGARHQIMQILAPVFETSLKLRWRFKDAHQHFTAMIDSLPEALVAFGADGEEHYRNQAFQDLPLGESGRAAVARAAHELAAEVCRTLRANTPSQPLTAQRDLSLPCGSYELRAFITPSLLTRPGVMVWVERDALLPPPEQLEAYYGLTPRQAEVALLMAQGLSDRAIAERLVISPHTARRHAEGVLKKMNLSSRAGVALACVQSSPSR